MARRLMGRIRQWGLCTLCALYVWLLCACGESASPAETFIPPTATPTPPAATSTPTRRPTVTRTATPTPIPPTLTPTATHPPTATPTWTATPFPLPRGMAGLQLRNYSSIVIGYMIDNQAYQIPARPGPGEFGVLFIVLKPGRYSYRAQLVDGSEAGGELDVRADHVLVFDWTES